MDKKAELLRLVENVRDWVRDNLQEEQAHTVRLLLIDLHNIATNHPEQAGAALIGAKTMWHMLRDDAWTGFGVRHGRKSGQYYGEVSVEAVVQALDAIREEQGISKTKAVPLVAKQLECSQRTVWSKLKEAEK